MQPHPQETQSAAADIEALQGQYKMLKFLDLGGTLTPPSDDPSDWFEPENLTYRAMLHGVQSTGESAISAVTAWAKAARQIEAPRRRATDGRPDCPYNGQGLAPGAIPNPAA